MIEYILPILVCAGCLVCGIWLGREIWSKTSKLNTRWLQRFRIAPVRKAEPMEEVVRRRSFQNVGDSDPCLLAVIDLLEEKLFGNIGQMMDRSRPDKDRIDAANSAADAYFTLQTIDQERAAAPPGQS